MHFPAASLSLCPCGEGGLLNQAQLINVSAVIHTRQPPRKIEIWIMASANPIPADYDSGEDVIEVAFPPPSSFNPPTRSSSSQQPPQPQQPHPPAPEQEDELLLALPAPRRRSRFDRINRGDHNEAGGRHLFRDPVARAAIHRRVVEYQQDRSGLSPVQQTARAIVQSFLVQREQPHPLYPFAGQAEVELAAADAAAQQDPGAAQPAAVAPVIDLTNEPDSPTRTRTERRHSRAHRHSHNHRHPRRTNSQRTSPPSLERSDGSSSIPRSMRMASNVIDLTGDSSPSEDHPLRERPREVIRQPTLQGATRPHHRRGHHRHSTRAAPRTAPHPHPPPRDELVRLGIVHNAGRANLMPDIRGLGRRLAGYLGADIIGLHALNAITGNERNVGRDLFQHEAVRLSPKPALEVPSAAREGFTRDTKLEDEENIVVCPCCEEELAYDPKESAAAAAAAASSSPPISKKRKRAPGEHHFWAVKKCGHVSYPPRYLSFAYSTPH